MPESSAQTVADEIKAARRGRGRPAAPGSDPKKRARWRAAKERSRSRREAASPEPAEGERPPYEANEASIAMCAMLGNTLWELSRLLHRHRSLNDEERTRLGAAIDPLMYKYLPALDAWMEETNFVATVWGLWTATEPPPEEASPANKPSSSSAWELDEAGEPINPDPAEERHGAP